jgi:hypothetical protein
MTQEDIEKIRFAAQLKGELDKYVYLREDDEGKYIEYAFIEGAPHDNRCLSWYDSYQEEAYIRNHWTRGLSWKEEREYLSKLKKKRDDRVGGLFRLSSFTCGYEESQERRLEEAKKSWEEYHKGEPFVPEDHICKVGKPANKCRDLYCRHWTYDEPVKCACWYLHEAEVPKHVNVPIDLAMKSIKLTSEE